MGEERAWGRRLAKRFGVDGQYDEQSFVVKANGQGFLDHESLKPEKIKPELAALFATVSAKAGGSVVVHGWVMAEDLVKLGALTIEPASAVEAVIRRRRMTRSFDPTPLDQGLVADLLDLARRAPSAGYSQGVHFLALTGDAVPAFWRITGGADWFDAGITAAPVLVLPLADPGTYTSRYSEGDKAGHGLEVAANWEVPFWITDAAMAAQNLLLLAEERGLGALYFGIFRNARLALDEFGVPPHVLQVGAVALGYRAAADVPSGSATTRARRPRRDVVHHQRW